METPEIIEAKRKIFGDILVSSSINSSLKKWRRIFKVSQVDLARWMGIASSVISEYENREKRSPGTRFLKKFVDSLIDIDMKRGGKTVSLLLSSYKEFGDEERKAILFIQDFTHPYKASELIDVVDGEILAGKGYVESYLYGFTVLDSLSTILTLSGESFYRIFGRSSERALIFTNVSTGRSPMVAVRVYPLKPRMVVIHKPRKVDPLSIKIAEKERILYVLSRLTEKSLIKKLMEFNEKILSEGTA